MLTLMECATTACTTRIMCYPNIASASPRPLSCCIPKQHDGINNGAGHAVYAMALMCKLLLKRRWYNEDMLLDPYAPLISGRRQFGVRDEIEEFEEKVRMSVSCMTSSHQL